MTSQTKFCHMNQVTMGVVMWPKFGNSSIYIREVIITSVLEGFDQKNRFFWGVALVQVQWFGTGLDTNLKFHISLLKVLKLKARKFWGLILTFVEVTGEKLVVGPSCPPSPSWIGLKPRFLITSEKKSS